MRLRAHVLTSPLFLCAVVVLVLNDHVFKAAWPSPISGKLSDFAGVVVIAIALSVLLGRGAAVTATAIGFTALKAVPGINQLVAPLLGGVTLTDRTDLIALAALVPTYWWLGRNRAVGRRGMERLRVMRRGRRLLARVQRLESHAL